MSFAGPDDPLLHVALEKAREKGVILIAAAGNGGPQSAPLYPGADPNVIAVTATDEHDAIFAQANQGPYVAIAAPGVNVLEPAPSGGYQIVTGTSVAAAHVSGVAALLLERNPNIGVDALRNILQSTAKHLTSKGRDDEFGWGLIDPYRALQAVEAIEPVAASNPSNHSPASSR
jgi:subtilisin family serine protease